MSFSGSRRLPKSPGEQMREKKSSDSHISIVLSSQKMNIVKNLKLERNHSSSPSDIKPLKEGAGDDFRSTSKKQKISAAGYSQEPIFTLSVKQSSVCKKPRSKVRNHRQNKNCSFVENDANRGNGNLVARNNLNPNVIIAVEERDEVKHCLKLFRELHKELLRQKGPGPTTKRIDIEASNILKKKGKWIHRERRLGHIPGIAIGDQFNFRAELLVVGLHCQYTSGIDYMILDGKKHATSIVNSGRYENKAESENVLIYSGQGGQAAFGPKADQMLEKGNLALSNNIKAKFPVRVIRRRTSMNDRNSFTYIYDGLYMVKKFWQERDRKYGKLVFKYELHRISGQETVSHQTSGELSKMTSCCVLNDVSEGKENMPIRAMNGIDSSRPPNFTYITKLMYSEKYEQIQNRGCDCTNGCSNLERCLCMLNENGRKGAVVYECGSSCKCPSSCKNRVSQNGLSYRLELFKIGWRDWGVRSRSFISSGSFICEYLGKLVPSKNVDHDQEGFGLISDNDENGMGFTIDAGQFGNVGRFIRYSESPNLLIQHVLYDHGDERRPHVVFFAAKDIPPLQELTCGYDDRKGEFRRWQYRLEM